jgi:hypothetical protein
MGIFLESQILIIERSIAQTITKREQGLTGKVVVVIATPGGLVVIIQRALAHIQRKSDGQSSRRIMISEQHICQ